MAPLVNLFGPLDNILGAEVGVGDVLVIEALIFLLVVVNFVTRLVAHKKHRSQAEEGAEAVKRYIPHEVTNVLLILTSFYYLTLEAHAGMVMAVLVLGLFISDFFEFEARKVEVRRDIPLERPKGALFAGLVALSYAAYQVLFFVVDGYIAAVV